MRQKPILRLLTKHGPEVIKLFSYSIQLRLKSYLQINRKLLINIVVSLLSLADVKFSMLINMKMLTLISWHFRIYQQRKFGVQLS